VNALLTGTYVVATIFIVRTSLRGNYLQLQSLRQSVLLESERLRPNVIFDLEIRDHKIFAVARNIGLTPAIDVKIKMTPELNRSIRNELSQCVLTDSPIAFLAPNREITDFIAMGPEFFTRYPEPSFAVEVSYSSRTENLPTEKATIDLTSLKNRLSVNVLTIHDLTTELQSVRNELRGIKDALAARQNR
jgi:hypothetical protein